MENPLFSETSILVGVLFLNMFFSLKTDARFAFDHAFAIKGQGTVLTGAR